MKDMKRYIIVLIVVGQVLMLGCGEDSTESVILGTWLGTNIVREDCDDVLNNGALNCKYDIGQCLSCIEFVLNRNGTYSLSAIFDGSPSAEIGEYEAKNNSLTLDPSNGDAYELPISNVSDTEMVIDLQLTNGCTAIITLKNSDC